MPFQSRDLAPALCRKIDDFIAANDMPALYRSYSWGNDAHAEGFPDILKLETALRASDQGSGVSAQDAQDVARWGALPGWPRVRLAGNAVSALPPLTLRDPAGNTQPPCDANPEAVMRLLATNTVGIGPAYDSKVLRFACPEDFGAIDTWLVRVFGRGDPLFASDGKWLSLKVTQDRDKRWGIPEDQRGWLAEYAHWIQILRYIAARLNAIGVACPHPPSFVRAGLRRPGEWFCADVEMVLSAHAHSLRAARERQDARPFERLTGSSALQ
jgi:hypothetical protein